MAADTLPHATGSASGDAGTSASSTTSTPPSSNTSSQDIPLAGSKEFNEYVVRQVEYYLSDDNLINDAHLLGKLVEDKYANEKRGNGLISINQLQGYSRLRKYKPLSAVKKALSGCTTVEVVDTQYVRRKIPFDMKRAQVIPHVNQDAATAQKAAILAAEPHLTRGMLSTTGFEHGRSEKLTQEQVQQNQHDFDPTRPIYDRLETAISRFRDKRKFHQDTAKLFSTFLDYCGFSTSQSMFTGGISKEEMEGWSPEEKRKAKQTDYVQECVIDSMEAGDGKWEVDIEASVKGFLSTRFPAKFAWDEPFISKDACNILRNWFKYLLVLNVLPDFEDQVHAAIAAINLAEKEFPILARAQVDLPGAFNMACSTLQGSSFAKLHYTGDWQTPKEAAEFSVGYSDEDAKTIVMTGIVAYGDEEQRKKTMAAGGVLKTTSKENDVGIEVTAIIRFAAASDRVKGMFQGRLKNTVVPPLGKLFCKRYKFPMAAPQDLPAVLPKEHDNFEFLVDDKALENCFVGMKMEVNIMKLDVGIFWIDHVHHVYGSFYRWCWNEVVKEWKEPGPPKEWMKKQQAMKDREGDTAVGFLGNQGDDEDDGYVVGQEDGPD